MAMPFRRLWALAACAVTALAVACSDDPPTAPRADAPAARPSAPRFNAAGPDTTAFLDTTGTVVFTGTLPLSSVDMRLTGYALAAFTGPTLIDLKVSGGLIRATHLPSVYQTYEFGPHGWYDPNYACYSRYGGVVVHWGGAMTMMSACPGNHTLDTLMRRLTVVSGQGVLGRGSEFPCEINMRTLCWRFAYLGSPTTVNVRKLDVPIVLQVESGGYVGDYVRAGSQATFTWRAPAWAWASGPAGTVPYKVLKWVYYPDGGAPVERVMSAYDSTSRNWQYYPQRSGRAEVTVRINGDVKTASTQVYVGPCPPTGDPRLDDTAFTRALRGELASSQQGTYRELGGDVEKGVSGRPFRPRPLPSTIAPSPCQYGQTRPQDLPAPTSGAVLDAADWHTHPHRPNTTYFGCDQPQCVGRECTSGLGPSLPDWESAFKAGRTGYMIDGNGEVWSWNRNPAVYDPSLMRYRRNVNGCYAAVS